MNELDSDVMTDSLGVGYAGVAPAMAAVNAATAAAAAGHPVDDGKSVPPGYTFPAEDIFLSKFAAAAAAARPTMTDWFKAPAWTAGPPRWQVTLAGTAVGVAVIAVVVGFVKK
jgi:hypothetical protein